MADENVDIDAAEPKASLPEGPIEIDYKRVTVEDIYAYNTYISQKDDDAANLIRKGVLDRMEKGSFSQRFDMIMAFAETPNSGILSFFVLSSGKIDDDTKINLLEQMTRARNSSFKYHISYTERLAADHLYDDMNFDRITKVAYDMGRQEEKYSGKIEDLLLRRAAIDLDISSPEKMAKDRMDMLFNYLSLRGEMQFAEDRPAAMEVLIASLKEKHSLKDDLSNLLLAEAARRFPKREMVGAK